jgi:hypothetical protein
MASTGSSPTDTADSRHGVRGRWLSPVGSGIIEGGVVVVFFRPANGLSLVDSPDKFGRRRGSTQLQLDVVPPSAVPGGRGALRSKWTPIMRITKHTAAAPNAGRVPS